MAQPADDSAHPSLGFERIVFFSDAVFAIVITLLVLPLTAEIDLSEEGAGGLASEVWELRQTVLSFVVSFLVIGQFWLAHHRMFGQLERHDQGLIWLNLICLLTVSFLPFPTAVLGEHSTAEDRFAIVFYAASMTVTSVTFSLTWLYALRRNQVDDRLDRRARRDSAVRSFATSAVFLLSIGAAFLGLFPEVLCWVALLPAIRVVLARLHRQRHEGRLAA